jgi:ribosome maturation factor RimP
MTKKISEIVSEAIETIVQNNDLFIWDVEYKTGKNAILTILLDKNDHQNVSMDEITEVTHLISDKLDEINPDPFDDEYMLDVSSPGVFRTLLNLKHYQWAKGMPVKVHLFQKVDGSKEKNGVLKNFNEHEVILLDPILENDETKILLSDIAKIQLNQEA